MNESTWTYSQKTRPPPRPRHPFNCRNGRTRPELTVEPRVSTLSWQLWGYGALDKVSDEVSDKGSRERKVERSERSERPKSFPDPPRFLPPSSNLRALRALLFTSPQPPRPPRPRLHPSLRALRALLFTSAQPPRPPRPPVHFPTSATSATSCSLPPPPPHLRSASTSASATSATSCSHPLSLRALRDLLFTSAQPPRPPRPPVHFPTSATSATSCSLPAPAPSATSATSATSCSLPHPPRPPVQTSAPSRSTLAHLLCSAQSALAEREGPPQEYPPQPSRERCLASRCHCLSHEKTPPLVIHCRRGSRRGSGHWLSSIPGRERTGRR